MKFCFVGNDGSIQKLESLVWTQFSKIKIKQKHRIYVDYQNNLEIDFFTISFQNYE